MEDITIRGIIALIVLLLIFVPLIFFSRKQYEKIKKERNEYLFLLTELKSGLDKSNDILNGICWETTAVREQLEDIREDLEEWSKK